MHADRQQDLVAAFVGLADTLVAGYDVVDLLEQLVVHCTELLDVSAAGLLLADRQGQLRVAAASSEDTRLLEQLQVQVGHGPCIECFSSRAPVVVGRSEELARRWPAFATAMSDRGHLSVAAVPLRLRLQAIGALNLFTDRAGDIDHGDLGVAQALADVATIGILQARAVQDSHQLSAQLQGALDSRIVIEQAKGVVASQSGAGVSEAFLLIRSHARSTGRPLTEVALAVVEGRLGAEELSAAATTRPRASRS